MSIQDKLFQLQESLKQQYNSLKILCDINSQTVVNITEKALSINSNLSETASTSSNLQEKMSMTQMQFSKSELLSNRLYFAPTVSVIFNQSWQQNSNANFFDNNSNWISSQYVGLKSSLPFPLDATKLSQSYNSKISFKIAKLNLEHNALQNKLNNEQLNIDYAKAYSTYTVSQKIANLKNINYEKSKNQYTEGITSTDFLLNSFGEKLNAELNQVSAASNIKFIQSKINFNNTIKWIS